MAPPKVKRCAYCGGPKRIPEHIARPPAPKLGAKRARPRKPSTYVDRAVYEADPFCSRKCCEAAQAEGKA